MNILVINGSPKRENSDTMKLTRAFLEGMGETAEVLDAIALDIKPCLGCFGCWHNTPGVCVHDDDMPGVLAKIKSADLLIWSTPLYCYGVPSPLKAVLDRLLPLSTPAQHVDEKGRTYHPAANPREYKMLLIAGCGFPDVGGNFDALEIQFERMFAGLPMILCAEAPLLSVKRAAPVARPYLRRVREAGKEYKKTGALAPETLRKLRVPMLDPDEYRRNVNG